MSEPIQPALTAEEWAARAIDEHQVRWYPSVIEVGYVGPTNSQHIPCQRYHALAALALYGQSFGFTREMVQAIRDCADTVDAERTAFTGDEAEMARTAADRIEALLPREKQ